MYREIELDNIDLTEEPPQEEPARQRYFIAKARKRLRAISERARRPMTFRIVTFGCQMNARDSEKLTGILAAIGYAPSDTEDADLVVYNTCTVRENANRKVYGHLGKLKRLKEANPYMRIALCGCMTQEAQVVDKLKESYRFVDLVFGTHNIFQFAQLVCQMLESDSMVVEVWEGTDQIVEDLPAQRKYPFKSGVNIMFGCNNFCSYCIVPYVRGRERSRSPQAILDEIQNLVNDGVVEVMLLGQNVNSYGKTLAQPLSFARLLSQAVEIPGLRRVRFMTSHPKDLSDELIQVMASSDKICRHLHLPMQSGSDRILEKMNRRYTKESYLRLADKIQTAMPDIALTTDIIVGFPGETEEDFQHTLDVVRQVRYSSAFTFQYSKRTGTPAAVMEEQVPADVVQERFNRLLETVQDIAREECARWEGTTGQVLVEQVNHQDDALLTGRLGNNLLVHFPADRALIGKIVDVRLTECKGFYYMGEISDGNITNDAAILENKRIL